MSICVPGGFYNNHQTVGDRLLLGLKYLVYPGNKKLSLRYKTLGIAVPLCKYCRCCDKKTGCG